MQQSVGRVVKPETIVAESLHTKTLVGPRVCSTAASGAHTSQGQGGAPAVHDVVLPPPPADGGLLVRLVDGRVDGRHGLPALPVQRQQQVRHQADQLVLLYLVNLEEVRHAPSVLPTFLGHATVSLDDDCDHLLLAGVDVDNLDLAVFETEDKVSSSWNIS